MKVLFAGPSLSGSGWTGPRADGELDCRGPAGQGDIARAVVDGATAIGLIDGRYEDVAAIWHKEILYAIGEGVQVFGAASMGALRASECADFGMIGVGDVFERYRCGELVDDAAVAQLHAPAELDHMPLTEALVNVEATLDHFRKLQAISDEEAERLDKSARALFFKDRTYPAILAHAGLDQGPRGEALKLLIKRCRIDVKRRDATLLLDYLRCLESERLAPPAGWSLEQTATWTITLQRAQKSAQGAPETEEESGEEPAPPKPTKRPPEPARPQQPAPSYAARSNAIATP